MLVAFCSFHHLLRLFSLRSHERKANSTANHPPLLLSFSLFSRHDNKCRTKDASTKAASMRASADSISSAGSAAGQKCVFANPFEADNLLPSREETKEQESLRPMTLLVMRVSQSRIEEPNKSLASDTRLLRACLANCKHPFSHHRQSLCLVTGIQTLVRDKREREREIICLTDDTGELEVRVVCHQEDGNPFRSRQRSQYAFWTAIYQLVMEMTCFLIFLISGN